MLHVSIDVKDFAVYNIIHRANTTSWKKTYLTWLNLFGVIGIYLNEKWQV